MIDQIANVLENVNYNEGHKTNNENEIKQFQRLFSTKLEEFE